jgi:hypothetical protein
MFLLIYEFFISSLFTKISESNVQYREVRINVFSFVDIIFDVSTPSPKADHQYCWYADMALRVVVHPRDGETPFTITLVAQTAHEKAAWLSDLKQVSARCACSIDTRKAEIFVSTKHAKK